MRRLLPLILVALAVAGCGGGSKQPSHDLGGGWKVSWTEDGGSATIEKNGKAVDAGGIELRVLGPKRGATVSAIPQVAAEVSAPAGSSVQYALLVDGTPLDVKTGRFGNRITLYGAPASSLSPGRHVAVAAAEAGASAAAVAWPFTVR